MRMTLARVLFNFDVELHPHSSEWGTTQKVYIFWEKPDLKVIVKPRKV